MTHTKNVLKILTCMILCAHGLSSEVQNLLNIQCINERILSLFCNSNQIIHVTYINICYKK